VGGSSAGGGDWAVALAMAQKKTRVTFRNLVMSSKYASPARTETSLTISDGELQPETSRDFSTPLGMTTDPIRHLYVHIPFCARICPYCAFYKELLDRSQTQRFCEAILGELRRHAKDRELVPSTIYFGGGTPTALTTTQLEFLLGGFRDALDLSELIEWTMEANPGSVSAQKAVLLRKLGVTRISLGIQSWDDDLLQLLGRDHRETHLRESFRILRDARFPSVNVDLMFGLPGQTLEQWRATLEKTVALGPDHISTYCLTYEEDTEFFLRHARGEFRQDSDSDAEFFQTTMSILEAAGYEHYEISNYARPGFQSAHNRAYWSGANYLGIGPSAFSTIGMERYQNVPDFRRYADAVLAGKSPVTSVEDLTPEMKRTERIALALRTNEGAPAALLERFPNETREFERLGLLQRANGNFILTREGKAVADLVAEAFL
jgi:oxygen-independent coproporphyrinogen III oxidase